MNNVYYQVDPVIRGLITAGAVYAAIEFIKPTIFYQPVDEGQSYVARPFGGNSVMMYNEDQEISGTYFPWWTVVLLGFIVTGLLI